MNKLFVALLLAAVVASVMASRCSTGKRGVGKCDRKQNGEYQHCSSCKKFVMCRNGRLIERDCAPDKVWDDKAKCCIWWSTTCSWAGSGPVIPTKPRGCSTGKRGVKKCDRKRDGEYQHCSTCKKYVRCRGGRMTERSCAPDKVWDDKAKCCVWWSTTCSWAAIVPPKRCSTGSCGVTKCGRRNDGYYQHCSSCNRYVRCRRGRMSEKRCDRHKVWDDNSKCCVRSSTTCGCA